MNFKSEAFKLFAKFIHQKNQKWIQNPLDFQQQIFEQMISAGKQTKFGKEHGFEQIKTYDDFKNRVPLNDYEDIKSYIEQIENGESDVLWPGKPIYFAKTSGTTSGSKLIPITKESMPYHIKGARDAMLSYIFESGQADFVSGKMIFLQGSPELTEKNGIKTGRLSGIVAHYVPKYFLRNRMPSWETNCIEDWETKVDKIVDETLVEDMSLISGIPPWLVMYYERLINKSGKKNIKQIFPNLQLMITGGVNYNPYREKMKELIGEDLDVIQTYPASEGFIAYQDSVKSEDLLLLVNHGIFYEFVESDTFFGENQKRISLKDVKTDTDYVLVMNTNAGLWSYIIGDTIRFTSLKPYRIIVSGRIKHFTSAFGEHVITHEVEQALQIALEKFNAQVSEFTLAPQVNPTKGLPYHEWLIEFSKEPADMNAFAENLDQNLRKLNTYYDDLIKGSVLRSLKISRIKPNGFNIYLESKGKLGGQNKMPKLSNDRKIADEFYNLDLIIK